MPKCHILCALSITWSWLFHLGWKSHHQVMESDHSIWHLAISWWTSALTVVPQLKREFLEILIEFHWWSRESNPALRRESRGLWPLHYHGLDEMRWILGLYHEYFRVFLLRLYRRAASEVNFDLWPLILENSRPSACYFQWNSLKLWGYFQNAVILTGGWNWGWVWGRGLSPWSWLFHHLVIAFPPHVEKPSPGNGKCI